MPGPDPPAPAPTPAGDTDPPSRHGARDAASTAPRSRRARAARASGTCGPPRQPPPARPAPGGSQPAPYPGDVLPCRVGALLHPPRLLGNLSVWEGWVEKGTELFLIELQLPACTALRTQRDWGGEGEDGGC